LDPWLAAPWNIRFEWQIPSADSRSPTERLDNFGSRSKIPPISDEISRPLNRELKPGFMTPSTPSPLPEKRKDPLPCKHPRVQIVAREEDTEFVECKECGEVFESSEFKDMNIEDTKLPNES
jgi:hypothetical protein